jgi:hypothetical protein
MRELVDNEVGDVSGAGFWADVGYVVGKLAAMGTEMQQSIDSSGNEMLGAMSQGA